MISFDNIQKIQAVLLRVRPETRDMIAVASIGALEGTPSVHVVGGFEAFLEDLNETPEISLVTSERAIYPVKRSVEVDGIVFFALYALDMRGRD